MRFILRFISFLALAAAVVLAVFDTILSIAGSGFTLSSFGEVWARFSPATLAAGLDSVARLPFSPWPARGLGWVLAEPAAAVLLVLALAAWIAGYRKVPAAGRFAA